EARPGASPLRLGRPAIRRSLAGPTADLAAHAAQRIPAKYVIPVSREELATSLDEARAAAERVGYPVALKIQSPDISHKTEAKAVRLSVGSDAELAEAYEELATNARAYRVSA